MRILVCSLLIAGVFGCSMEDAPKPAVAQKDKSQPDPGQPKRRSPGGMAGLVAGDFDAQPVGNGGQNQTPAPAPVTNTKTIPQVESRIVEWPKYGQEHPEVVAVDTKVDGWDPYSTAASAYVNIPARVEALAGGYNAKLQSQLNALEGGGDPKPLSYEEFAEGFCQFRSEIPKPTPLPNVRLQSPNGQRLGFGRQSRKETHLQRKRHPLYRLATAAHFEF